MGVYPMKIVQVTPFYYPEIGGVETYVRRLSIELANRGHDVCVVTSRLPKFPPIGYQENIKIIRLSCMGRENPYPMDLLKTINNIKPDLINTHGFLFYFSFKTSKLYNKYPLVFTFHGDFQFLKGFDRIIYGVKCQIIGRNMLTKSDHIIVTSRINKGILIKKFNVPPPKISIIPYGVDHTLFTPKKDGILFKNKFNINADYILCVSRLEKEKGIDILLRAYAKIYSKHLEVSLVIIGEGSHKDDFVRLAKKLKISDRVFFVGPFPHGELLTSAYAGARIFVLPSIKEPFGIVLLEAIASGTPIVASNDGGFAPEIIKQYKNGLLFDSGNYVDLSSKILFMLENPEIAKNMANRLRDNNLSSFKWDEIVNKVLDVYNYIYSRRCCHEDIM